jgi:two-component system KDP operon response regulator KdpE
VSDPLTHILVVDDEPPIARVLSSSLKTAGYRVTSARNGADALSAVATMQPDIIVLDLGLPDMDGKDVIAELRQWTDVPILVLSARHDEAERIAALDRGADDFVSKPFHMGELQARLRAALRHSARRAYQQTEYVASGLVIDFEKRRVSVDGQEIKLTRKEYDLLRTLAQHSGQVVTHKQLLAAGWGSTITDTQFVRVYVGQLRQKLEVDPSAPKLILTEPGIGYRLIED